MADLPYRCRSGDHGTTIAWTRRFRDDTGADAVKLEVTAEHLPLVERLAAENLPIVAHLGLLPQMIDPATGYKARGRRAEEATRLLEDAVRMESAGAAMLLLEAVATEVAAEITARVTVPVIGCVAGPHCDGTVVVLHDMIGIDGGHPPRMVKRYGEMGAALRDAFAAYAADIRAGRFPTDEHSIHMAPGERDRWLTPAGKR